MCWRNVKCLYWLILTSEQHFIDKCLLCVCGQLYFILSDGGKKYAIMAPFFSVRGVFGGRMCTLKVSVCIDLIVQGCDVRNTRKNILNNVSPGLQLI